MRTLKTDSFRWSFLFYSLRQDAHQYGPNSRFIETSEGVHQFMMTELKACGGNTVSRKGQVQ